MYCGTSIDREIVRTYPGEGTGDTIYVTKTGRHIYGRATCGALLYGYHWTPTNRSDTYSTTATHTKTAAEMEAEEWAKELEQILKKARRKSWIKLFHDPPVYRPRFRRVQMLTKPEDRVRSNPIHVRNRPWDPRERA